MTSLLRNRACSLAFAGARPRRPGCRRAAGAGRGRRRRGAILLEVLISLGLMVFGLAVVGVRINTSLETARKSRQWTTAVLLTETKISELQAGAVSFKPTDDQLAGYFGIRYPGYSWRIEIEPCEILDLYQMRLEIGYNPSVIQAQIDNPDMEIDFEDEGTRIIRTVHRLVPKPADLDLNRDFGIDLEGLQAQMGGGGGEGGEGGEGDPTGGAGNELWSLITQFLTEHPEILNDNGGIDLEAVKNLPAEDFQMAMQILEQFVGRGGGLRQLQDQLSENLGEAGGNQGGGRGGRGGQGGQGDDGQDGSGGPGGTGGINIGGGGGPGGMPGGRDGGGRDGGEGRDRGGRDGGRDGAQGRDRGNGQDDGGGARGADRNRGGSDRGNAPGGDDAGRGGRGRDQGNGADRGRDGGRGGNNDAAGRDRGGRDRGGDRNGDNRGGDARNNDSPNNDQSQRDRDRMEDRRSQFNRQGGTRGGTR